jgi:hypothetical protein
LFVSFAILFVSSLLTNGLGSTRCPPTARPICGRRWKTASTIRWPTVCISSRTVARTTPWRCSSSWQVDLMQHALYLMQHALYLMQHALYLMQHALYLMQHALYLMQHALYLMQYALYLMQHALYLMQHALYFMQPALYFTTI